MALLKQNVEMWKGCLKFEEEPTNKYVLMKDFKNRFVEPEENQTSPPFQWVKVIKHEFKRQTQKIPHGDG